MHNNCICHICLFHLIDSTQFWFKSRNMQRTFLLFGFAVILHRCSATSNAERKKTSLPVKRKPKFVATWLQDETSTAVYRPNFVDFFEVKQTTTVKRGKGGKKNGKGHNQKTTSSNSDKNHETPNGIVNPIPHVVSLQPMKDKSAEALREYRNKRVDTLD